MKRFNFPLDRVRRWRLEQLNVEELRLQQLRAELEGLAASKRLIQDELTETQRQVLGQTKPICATKLLRSLKLSSNVVRNTPAWHRQLILRVGS